MSSEDGWRPVVGAVRDLKTPLHNIERNTSQISDINFAIRDMEMTIQNLKHDLEKISRNQEIQKNMVVSEAEAKRYISERIINELNTKYFIRGKELEDKRNAVQHDYDKTQLEFIGNFVDSVSADTNHINMIKEEFDHLKELHSSFHGDLSNALYYDILKYQERRDELNRVVEETRMNIGKFIRKRERTAEDIDEILHKHRSEGNTVVYVPFWICGVRKGSVEKVKVIPPLDKMTPFASPPREAPYAKYLSDMEPQLKDKFEKVLKSNDVIEAARENSVLNDESIMDKALRHLDDLKSYFDRSDRNGGSVFIRFLRKFMGNMEEKGGRITTLVRKRIDPSLFPKEKDVIDPIGVESESIYPEMFQDLTQEHEDKFVIGGV